MGDQPATQSFSKKVLTTGVIGLGFVFLAYILYTAYNFFILVFLAILFSLILGTCARWISRKLKIGYKGSLAITVLLLMILTGSFLYFLFPGIKEQLGQFTQEFPKAVSEIRMKLSHSTIGKSLLPKVPTDGKNFFQEHQQELFSKAKGAFSIMLDLLIVFITGIFLAIKPEMYIKGVVSLFPVHRRERLYEVLAKARKHLRGWLFARLLLMTYVGVATSIGLGLIGVPLALSLGFIAGLLDFIPNIGPILGAIPGVLIALVASPQTALYAGLIYLGVQAIENYVLSPWIEEKEAKLPPVMNLFSQVLFGSLIGITGVLIATPLVTVVKVFVEELYIKDYLQAGQSQPN